MKKAAPTPAPSDDLVICRMPRATSEPAPKGPQYLRHMSWRIFRIMAEFVEGFEFLSNINRSVTVFGSARLSPDSPWYKEAEALGAMLGKCGFSVITGGGPGIMEAANKGAASADADSVGLNIQLPHEQRENSFVKRGHGFHYFFTRKVMLASSADAYVFFPGGLGTLDELFEMLVMVQTGKMTPLPIVLVGSSFWNGLIAWKKEQMMGDDPMIDAEDLELFRVVDTAKEAFDFLADAPNRTLF